MTFPELAHARYSCRAFDAARPVTDDELASLMDVVRAAPTAMNRQPFHMLVLSSEEELAKVDECTPCRYGAPLVVAFCAETGSAFVREDDGLNFAIVDASIAATHYILGAAELGLETCWVGRLDTSRAEELFPKMRGTTVVALVPTGHAAAGEKGAPSERHSLRKDVEQLLG